MAHIALPELNTRSILDVVEDNFKEVNLKTYAIRMIYIGEHTLPKDEIIEHVKKTIKGVNSSYCEIPVCGLFLVYDSYFVHILEGSEDTVHRHLRFLFKREKDWIAEMEELDARKQEEEIEGEEGLKVILPEEQGPKPERKFFRRLKIIMVYHSIRTLSFRGWRAVTARPPSLIGKLDVYGSMQDHLEQLRICIDKINKLCTFATNPEEKLSFEGLSAVDPKIEALPEVTLLDFLLLSPYLLDLRETAGLHRRVDDYRFYFEDVWPLQTHFTPRLLYKLKIDDSFVEQLPVMPWEIVKKETEDEEGREEREESDSD